MNLATAYFLTIAFVLCIMAVVLVISYIKKHSVDECECEVPQIRMIDSDSGTSAFCNRCVKPVNNI